MVKRKRQLLMTWIMALVMIINVFLPLNIAHASDISASILTDLMVTITQDGVEIPEGGSITSTKPIRVEISFGIPVVGDDPTPANPVQQGDTVTFNLTSAFKLLSSDTIDLKMGTLLVAHATFTTDPITKMVTAKVTFDGDDSVFNGDSHTVKCEFGADFEYDDSGSNGSTGDHTVTILGKTYTVNVPALPIVYDVTKTGTANLADQSITWTVYISATQGGAAVDLAGYKFFDDLQNVGTYISSSFKVDGTEVSPDTASNALRYTFPEDSTSPKTITFKTKIPDSAYYANSQQTVRNKAQLLDKVSKVVDEGEYGVQFKPEWIEKTGVSSDAGSSGVYNPKDRTIIWTITANNMGATLNNVVITDVLSSSLTFESANWQAWTGSDWGTKTFTTPNANGEYTIGNINSKILLTIVTKVPDEPYTTGRKTYSNSASIKWDGLSGSGLGTGTINVGVGYNAISKSGVAYTANQKIRWTVNVDTKGQDIPDLKVYDLLVYGNSINLGTASGIPSGITPTDLTPRYGQKYIGNFTGGTMAVNVIPIERDGVRVGDLLEITGLSTTTLNTFSFDTQVVDPNIFAGNKTSTVRNTATLFSANAKLNAADASVSYTNHMLLKGMLDREAMSDPASGVNSRLTSDAQKGFDYKDKSVIYRLNVNADGINLTGAINADGKTLGTAILTDTLPEGWEFVDIVSGSKYLIFEGTGQSNGNILAKDTTPDTVEGLNASFNGGTATFTFSSLNQPYVILVKAKPTNDTVAGYFDSNKTTTERNNVTLKTENWDTGVSSYRDVTITSQILDKTTVQPTTGELRWSIDYKPYDLALLGQKLEDQLPVGIDLRTDSSGTLLLDGNITANEMTLNADGSYTVGNPVTLELGSNVSYDNATRVLSFKIPDNTKAYRFSYITDITGEPGNVTNKVTLIGNDMDQVRTSKSYYISASDGSASLLRNGWISITKTNGEGAPLAGAEFTLYAMNGTTVIKKGVTGNDGTVKLKVIPDGEYILRETAAPKGYTLESVDHSVVVKTNGSTVTSSIDGKTGANANVITIKNFSEGTAGNLTISKTVAGKDADTTKEFYFTITLEDAPGTYTYIGYGIPGGTIASGDTIPLAHGQSITIVGLPKDATYTVTEADYSKDGYTSTSTGATGRILADTTQTALFTNTRTIGNLTISKTVAGNAGDVEKAFKFTITLNGSGATGTYNYTGKGVPDGTIKSGGTVFLSHGQSITITGIPEGTIYTVTEADYSKDGYTLTSTGATGNIVADATQIASFTNTRNVSHPSPGTGNLTISKTVTGNAGDAEKAFKFTITLNGSGATGTYNYTGKGVPDGTIKSGGTVFLSHGQSITITGIPEGTIYTVTEADYSKDGYTLTSTGATGNIVADATQIASFTNTRNVSHPSPGTGNLTISKTVTGNAGDAEKAFKFTITLNGSGATGTYNYTGKGVPDGTIKSGGTVFLSHGQSITITGIPEGTIYTVTEADYSKDGYTLTSTGATGNIVADATQIASFTNTRNVSHPSPGTGNLTISKTVTGQGADFTKKFKFTVTFIGVSDAYPYTGASTGTIHSGDTILLASGESITITGLPAGTQYTVTEADYSKDGYTSTSTGAVGTISADTLQTASFTNSHGNTPDNAGAPGNPTNNIGDGGTSQGSVDGGKDGMPYTGDNQAGGLAKLGLLFFSITLMALTAADLALRKKYFRKGNQK